MVFLVAKSCIQFCLHQLLQDILETVFQKRVYICNAINVVF